MLQAVLLRWILKSNEPRKVSIQIFISVYVASFFVPPDQVGKERLLLD